MQQRWLTRDSKPMAAGIMRFLRWSTARRLLAVATICTFVTLVSIAPFAAAQSSTATFAAVQAACDRGNALLNAGYVADAEAVFKSELGLNNKCAEQGLSKVFAIKGARNPTAYFNSQIQVIRGLVAAGFETEARNQAQALIEANPNRPIPPDIRSLNQRLGWWRLFLGDIGPPLRTALELLIGAILVIVVLLLVCKAAAGLYRRWWPPTYTIGSVTGIDAADAPKQTGRLTAELSSLTSQSIGVGPIRRAASQEQELPLPDAVTSAFPESKLLMALVSLLDRLLPRRLTQVNIVALPEDPTRGLGLTVQIATRSARAQTEETVWERDYFQAKQGANVTTSARIGRMMLPAAVWLAYQPTLQVETLRQQIHRRLSSTGRAGARVEKASLPAKSASYAHFAVGELLQGEGTITEARRAYDKALDYNKENADALLNLAGLKLYRDKPKDATATREANQPTGQKIRISCRIRGLCHRPGSGGQRPPRASIASAIAACGEWNPNARRVIRRSWVFTCSTRAFDSPLRMAASIPGRCSVMV